MDKEYKRIYEEINYLRDDVVSSEVKQTTPYINGKIMVKEPKRHLLNHINTIEQYVALSLTPPNAEQLCKALSEWSNEKVIYDERDCAFGFIDIDDDFYEFVRIRKQTKTLDIDCMGDFTPHLITMIGRFYERIDIK